MIGDLKGEALDSLEGKWGLAVGATLLISILISAFSFSVDFIFSQFWDWKEVKNSLSVDVITILVIGPLTLGGYYLALHIIREKDARIGNIFRWFTGGSKFIKSFLLYIVVNIFIIYSSEYLYFLMVFTIYYSRHY